MKRVLWLTTKYIYEFNLTWFELWIFKRIMAKRKMIKNDAGLRGYKAHLIYMDEFSVVNKAIKLKSLKTKGDE